MWLVSHPRVSARRHYAQSQSHQPTQQLHTQSNGADELPPAPTPRPVVVDIVRSDVDLYQWANYLFFFCASGYFFADLSRVLWPVETINENRGNNITNAIFLFFALCYVLDATLYFLVYNQWERDALEDVARADWMKKDELEESRIKQVEADDEEHLTKMDVNGTDEDEKSNESDSLAAGSPIESEGATSVNIDGVHRRKVGSDAAVAVDGHFAGRLMDGQDVAKKARWCFFSHEGGLVNVLEICAALICATDATMSFFAGIANVDRIIQRRWDAATMTGDAVAAAIFLTDSIIFQHIYMRTLQTKAQMSGSSQHVSCIQTKDPYFWTSIFNVVGSVIYFVAATWGVVKQDHISSLDNINPGSYNANMLPMLHLLHGLFLIADVF